MKIKEIPIIEVFRFFYKIDVKLVDKTLVLQYHICI